MRRVDGVLLDGADTAVVADALIAYIRLTRSTDLRLAQIALDLARAADSADDGSRSSPSPSPNVTLTVDEYARLVGRSSRAVRQACRDGRIPARKQGTQWAIEPPPPKRPSTISSSGPSATTSQQRSTAKASAPD